VSVSAYVNIFEAEELNGQKLQGTGTCTDVSIYIYRYIYIYINKYKYIRGGGAQPTTAPRHWDLHRCEHTYTHTT